MHTSPCSWECTSASTWSAYPLLNIASDIVSPCLYYLDQSKKRLKNQETKSTNSISTMGSSDSSSSSSSIESDGSDHESTLQSREPDKIFFKTPGFSGKAI